MMQDNRKRLTRAAMLLAVAVAVQNIRVVLPLPPFISMFLIGSLVNMILLVAVWCSGKKLTLVICALLPIVAFLQGQLPIMPMIFVVLLGNMVFVLWCSRCWQSMTVWLAPFIKMAVMCGGTFLVLKLVVLPEKVAGMLVLMMSWPQIITGIIGIVLASLLIKRLKWLA